MTIFLNLFALIFTAICVVSLCPKQWLKWLLSILLGIFICMQICSLYISGNFCDYKFFAHFNVDNFLWGAKTYFKTEVILLPLVFIGICAGLFFAGKISLSEKIFSLLKIFPKGNARQWRKSITKARHSDASQNPLAFINSAMTFVLRQPCIVFLALCLTFLFFTKNGIVHNLREVYLLSSIPTTFDFDSALRQVETTLSEQTGTPVVFRKKQDLEAEAEGKNIVMISLESFERAFFHDKNKHLAPHLRQLMREWNYFPMAAENGSSWTIASFFTAFTGLPCFFMGYGTQQFESMQEFKLINMTDILKKTGYEMYLFSENATFGGTRNLANAFGIQHILDDWKLADHHYSDLNIFEKAKQILNDSSRKKPACLYISTFATHTPDGFPDPRLFPLVAKQKTDLETAANQTDYLVADFIKFLKQTGLMENTIVYIFPDHLFMGSPDLLETGETRALWFMTNADAKDLQIDTTNFYPIDLPRNILSGAKIKHNAVFLSDFIQEDKHEFIEKNKRDLAMLNTISMARENYLDQYFEVSIRDGKVTCLFDKTIVFSDSVSVLKENERYIFLSNGLKILDTELVKNGMVTWKYYELYVKIGVKNNQLNVVWGRDDNLKKIFPPTKKLQINHVDIGKIYDSFKVPEILFRTIEKPRRGLSLLDYLQQTLSDSSKIIVMSAHDDASVYFSKLKPILGQVGLKETLENHFRWSYMSIFSNHKIYCEKASEHALRKKILINGTVFDVASSGGFSNGFGHIYINNQNFSTIKRGLNFVIFNTRTHAVEDVFSVDFFEDENLKMN